MVTANRYRTIPETIKYFKWLQNEYEIKAAKAWKEGKQEEYKINAAKAEAYELAAFQLKHNTREGNANNE